MKNQLFKLMLVALATSLFTACSQSKSVTETQTDRQTHRYNKTYYGNRIIYRENVEKDIPAKEIVASFDNSTTTKRKDIIIVKEQKELAGSASKPNQRVKDLRTTTSSNSYDYHFKSQQSKNNQEKILASPDATNDSSDVFAILGFILGLIGLIFFWLPILNLIFIIPGLVFSILGLDSSSSRGLAIAGVVLSALALLIFLLILI